MRRRCRRHSLCAGVFGQMWPDTPAFIFSHDWRSNKCSTIVVIRIQCDSSEDSTFDHIGHGSCRSVQKCHTVALLFV